jgi:ABC-2 type transport system ATP-binding protein
MSNVTKRYGRTVAVSELSFEVEPGEAMGLLGPNGAGKSTTLYMLAGLVRPNSGTISLFGKDLHEDFLAIARRMGVLLERPVFYGYLSVRRNLKLHARLAGREVNLDRAMDLAGLLEVANVKAGALSHGQRQRLGLAHAMLTEPELLILDEPTAGLDVESTQEILGLLRRLKEEAKVTILFSSHLMHEVETLCDRVAILNQGHLLRCERTASLLSYDLTCVEVLLEGAEGAAKRLLEQPWVTQVEARPGRIEVRLSGASPHQLNSFLNAAGYQITGLIPRRRTLQDYFLKVLNSE